MYLFLLLFFFFFQIFKFSNVSYLFQFCKLTNLFKTLSLNKHIFKCTFFQILRKFYFISHQNLCTSFILLQNFNLSTHSLTLSLSHSRPGQARPGGQPMLPLNHHSIHRRFTFIHRPTRVPLTQSLLLVYAVFKQCTTIIYLPPAMIEPLLKYILWKKKTPISKNKPPGVQKIHTTP